MMNNLDILKDIQRIMDQLPKDPIVEFMKDKGFDPKDGCVIILPSHLSGTFPERNYILYSKIIEQPMLMRSNLMGYGARL